MSKKQLENYGRTLGVELDRRHSKESLIEELKEVEGE
jgi:flagellar biosynthesis GTPase FlhF